MEKSSRPRRPSRLASVPDPYCAFHSSYRCDKPSQSLGMMTESARSKSAKRTGRSWSPGRSSRASTLRQDEPGADEGAFAQGAAAGPGAARTAGDAAAATGETAAATGKTGAPIRASCRGRRCAERSIAAHIPRRRLLAATSAAAHVAVPASIGRRMPCAAARLLSSAALLTATPLRTRGARRPCGSATPINRPAIADMDRAIAGVRHTVDSPPLLAGAGRSPAVAAPLQVDSPPLLAGAGRSPTLADPLQVGSPPLLAGAGRSPTLADTLHALVLRTARPATLASAALRPPSVGPHGAPASAPPALPSALVLPAQLPAAAASAGTGAPAAPALSSVPALPAPLPAAAATSAAPAPAASPSAVAAASAAPARAAPSPPPTLRRTSHSACARAITSSTSSHAAHTGCCCCCAVIPPPPGAGPAMPS
eukprot:365261-Chlamydomonas_euryale.AAC.6